MTTEKKTLKYIEYRKLISKEVKKYEQTIKTLQETYYDFDEIKHLFQLKPLSYIEYCENFNYEPEKNIINIIKEKEGVETEKDEPLYD